MKPENIQHLCTVYKRYYHPSVDALPDGWLSIIDDFFLALEGIGDLNSCVSVRFERGPSGLKAYCYPEMRLWNVEQMNALRVAQRELYGLSQQTCELCGFEGAADGHQVRCISHAGAPAALYREVRELFPKVHGSAINLSVPDHLFELLASTLRSIHKLVRSEDIVGKVLITRVEMDDGALFVRVRYNDLKAVFMGAQMSINEMISDLEVLSDELTRKHNKGGSDASV